MRRIPFDNRGMTDVPVAQEAIDSIRINALRGQKIAPVVTKQVGHRALILLTDGFGQRIGCPIGRAKRLLRHHRGRKHE